MDTADQSNLRRALINSLILLSAGAAAIHFAVIRDHFDEYWAFGVFFAGAAWLQVLWAIALAANVSRWLVIAGVLGNAVIVAVWIFSRTSGLPVGPHAGTAESVEFIDTLATGFEELIMLGGVVLLRGSAERSRIGPRAAAVATIAIALIVVPLTTAAIATVSVPDKESDRFDGTPGHQVPKP